jgi:hypothetical protein
MRPVSSVTEKIKKATRRTGVARVVLVGAIVVPAVLVAAQAAAAESWMMSDTPAPSGASAWQFNGVSCSSATSCEAVGSSSNSTGNHVLAEMHTSSGWEIWSTPEPAGATSDEFNGISCQSNLQCIGVGDYYNGTDTVTLTEVLNDGWTLRSSPNPAGATTAQLEAVSCSSMHACTAVGTSSDGTSTSMLAERWNGSHWAIQAIPSPAGAVDTQLDGISCTSGTSCIAVGDYYNGTDTVTLAEAWNGSTWTIQTTPNPAGSVSAGLDGISCSSATACVAVGSGFAEGWDGSTWSLQTIAKPQGGTRPGLSRVSCSSSTACTAVGISYHEGVGNAAAEAWNGTSWKVQAINITTSYDSSYLSDVSCVSATACTAVGSYHDPVDGYRALAEVFSLKWQLQDPPNPAGSLSDDFGSVSCTSATACTAVGNFEASGSVFEPVVEGWNGTSWTIESTPNPTVSYLSGVSCTAAKACTAVGDYSKNGKLVTLAERWNGTTWTVQSTPNVQHATKSYLISVSCTSGTACMAVGFYAKPDGTQLTFSETWNGTSWKLQTTPDPAGTTSSALESVSCTSASQCIAVGNYLTPSYTLLTESWNGTSWTIQPVTNVSGTTDGVLSGVSCSSATACMAVGGYDQGSRAVALSEIWNGTTWTPHATPPLAKAKQTALASVSCESSGQCTAVGFIYKHHHAKMLAEAWNGSSWGVLTTVIPAGSIATDLVSLSCPSTIYCTAVGYYEDSTGDTFLLAEQYS